MEQRSNSLMRIFISHASEDKSDIVRPLAEALRLEYDVWYDEYELTLGDSLFQRINEGLTACDYGIVILSKAFFGRRWTRAELDGLFALESASKKIILPVWKDVSLDEVRGFSPILAGRLGVSTSEGLDAVVGAIRRAVQVAERTREISLLQSAEDAIRALDKTLKERTDSALLLEQEEGVGLINEALRSLYETLEARLSRLSQSLQVLKFHFSHALGREFCARTNVRVGLHLILNGISMNSASQCTLEVRFFRRSEMEIGENADKEVVRELEFKPKFRTSKKVVWVEDAADRTYTTEELAGYLLDEFKDQIEREIESG